MFYPLLSDKKSGYSDELLGAHSQSRFLGFILFDC